MLGAAMGKWVAIETEGASAGRVGRTNGLTPEDLEAAGARTEGAVRALFEARVAGKAGFLDLPLHADAVGACVAAADDLATRCDTLVVAGMGGSALGARALLAALGAPGGDLLPPAPRPGRPRVVVLDTVDPSAVVPLLEGLPSARTCWNFVSKSGTTLETQALYGVVRPRLQADLGAGWRERVVVTTDPAEGPLLAEAKKERLKTLEIPAAVGGRFSVLSAAGLFPAAVAGVDVTAVLRGAGEAAAAFTTADPERNDALRLALWLVLLAERRGRRHHVLVAYRRSLAPLAAWWQQLWAESLGKKGKGFDATAAEGPAAQHSLLQLWMEGPADKAFVFLEAEDPGADRVVDSPGPPGAAWLARRTLGDTVRALAAGTRAGLLAAGRPVLRTTIPVAGPEAVGALLQTWMTAAALAGPLIGVDPFGQPGVEEGKRNAAALLGKEDERERRGRVEALLERGPGGR
jgi:glucose-6-phosphate isomerase